MKFQLAALATCNINPMQVTLVTRISSQMILVTFITAPYFKIRSPDPEQAGEGEEGKRGSQSKLQSEIEPTLRSACTQQRGNLSVAYGRGGDGDILGVGMRLANAMSCHTLTHTHSHTLVPIPQSMPP